MSKDIGETEQNMAAMFREAEAEDSILLLNEADRFLQDRQGAQRNYEVTEINEMLQGMERCHGIFICTTNLMDRIDQAALRQFTFKIQFKPLTRSQRETLFVAEACSGDAVLLEVTLSKHLAALDQLCPGDFAAVRRQANILNSEMTPLEFWEQLEAEHRIQPEVREARSIGFLQYSRWGCQSTKVGKRDGHMFLLRTRDMPKESIKVAEKHTGKGQWR